MNCPNCGNALEIERDVCLNCGHKLTIAERYMKLAAKEKIESEKSNRNTLIGCLVCCGFFILLGSL